jgi:hypothetical protein
MSKCSVFSESISIPDLRLAARGAVLVVACAGAVKIPVAGGGGNSVLLGAVSKPTRPAVFTNVISTAHTFEVPLFFQG